MSTFVIWLLILRFANFFKHAGLLNQVIERILITKSKEKIYMMIYPHRGIKRILISSFMIILVLFYFTPLLWAEDSPSFFQFSTINALLQGIYEGELTIGELLQKGNVGLGTFDSLNGEMVVIDGKCYRITDQGTAEEVATEEKTPFAAVAYFTPGERKTMVSIDSFDELKYSLDQLIESPNLIYIFHLAGTFESIRARSVSKQSKPYPPLTQATAKQAVFQFSHLGGDLIGFWCPEFFEGLNVPGYHFHFIDADRKQGGHLLDCVFQKATLTITACYQVSVQFPQNLSYTQADLAGYKGKEIQQVEK